MTFYVGLKSAAYKEHTKKSWRVQKWYTDILYLRAKFGGDPPLHGGVGNKSLVFLFLFVCLFVTLWILIRGLVIQIL